MPEGIGAVAEADGAENVDADVGPGLPVGAERVPGAADGDPLRGEETPVKPDIPGDGLTDVVKGEATGDVGAAADAEALPSEVATEEEFVEVAEGGQGMIAVEVTPVTTVCTWHNCPEGSVPRSDAVEKVVKSEVSQGRAVQRGAVVAAGVCMELGETETDKLVVKNGVTDRLSEAGPVVVDPEIRLRGIVEASVVRISEMTEPTTTDASLRRLVTSESGSELASDATMPDVS